jgi:alpha-N-acetylglucosaminidase
MMRDFHGLIKSKRLNITGIDINPKYLTHCNKMIKKFHLENNFRIICLPIETFEPESGQRFDYILFSMSFMLIKDQRFVLNRLRRMIKPEGKILFFQTMFKRRSALLDFVKPRLKYLTTVDFGVVTYEEDFNKLITEQKLCVEEDRMLKKEWFGGEYHLFITHFIPQ